MQPGQGTFSPIDRRDGYLPIEDHGLLGNGSTAALVGRDGAISWLCVPRFDSAPLFCSILDHGRGGSFVVAPDDVVESRQRYEPDTGVVVTELRSPTGLVRVTDCLVLPPDGGLTATMPEGCGELLRSVAVLDGEVDLRVRLDPLGGAAAERHDGAMRITAHRQPDLHLELVHSVGLHGLDSRVRLGAGDRADLVLRWGTVPHRQRRIPADRLLRSTIDSWHSWATCIAYDGPQEPLVRRSTITLKMLDFAPTGAMVAAPTSSLPEWIGGPRNWDYRYAWVRDVAFSVYALRRVGLDAEAWEFLGWVLDAVEHFGEAEVLYTLDGLRPGGEREDPDLEGYRRSRPVRWGNGAADQRQHDAYGEILDCAYQWAAREGGLEDVWGQLRRLVTAAAERWDQPDHGIWEVRTPGRVFTYSAAMCQVALDRGARLVERLGLPGDAEAWHAEAQRIRATIIEHGWDDEQRAITDVLGPGGGLDASTLALPLRRVVPADHPRMVATVQAITERLGAGDGLLYRYLPEESPDGLQGEEGAFVLCSFWLVDNLAHQGRLDEASDLYDSLCDRASPLGLLAEQIDPSTGHFLGNFPQAFSHIGLISSGMNLARACDRR